MGMKQGVEVSILLIVELVHLLEVGNDEGFVRHLDLRVHKVQGGPQGVDVQAIGVVDDDGVLDAFEDFGAHADARELLQALVDGVGRIAEFEHGDDGVCGVFDGGRIKEGDME